MKIYVITKGEYSEYHICAATTDKERAEFLREFASKKGVYGEEARIEEFDDYSGLTPMKGDVYEVVLYYKQNGEQCRSYCFREYVVDGNEIPDTIRYLEEDIHGKIKKEKNEFNETIYRVIVVAENQEKAEKIGHDIIYKYRAKEVFQ